MTGTADDGIAPVTEITANLIGTVLDGRYEILSVQSASDDAVIFKARHQLMNRMVAIKMMRSSLESDPARIEDFKKEASAQCSSGGPDGKGVFDFGVTQEGRPYLVMSSENKQDRSAQPPVKSNRSAIAWGIGLVLAVAAGVATYCFLRTDSGQLELTRMLLVLQDLKGASYDADRSILLRKAGDLCMKTGRFADAVSLFKQRGDAVYRKTGGDSLDYFEALADIVSAENHLPGYIEAKEDRNHFKAMVHPTNMRSLSFVRSGTQNGAIDSCERVYRATVEVLGKDDRLAVECLLVRADIRLHFKELDQSLADFQQALQQANALKEVRKQAAALRGLGSIHLAQNKMKEAEEAFKQLLAIDRSNPDSLHSDTMQDLHLLASLYSYQGEEDRAIACYEEGLKICNIYFLPSAREALQLVNRYMENLVSHRRLSQAGALVEKTIGLVRPLVGADSPKLLELYVHLAVIKIQEGDEKQEKRFWQEALNLTNSALAIALKLGDPVLTIGPINYIAEAQRRLGQTAEAEAGFKKIIAMNDKLPPTDLFQICNAWRGLAEIKQSQGNESEALACARKAVEMFEGLGPGHWENEMQCQETLSELVRLQAVRDHDRAKFAEAERCYTKQLAILEEHGGSRNPIGDTIRSRLDEVRHQK